MRKMGSGKKDNWGLESVISRGPFQHIRNQFLSSTGLYTEPIPSCKFFYYARRSQGSPDASKFGTALFYQHLGELLFASLRISSFSLLFLNCQQRTFFLIDKLKQQGFSLAFVPQSHAFLPQPACILASLLFANVLHQQ